MHEDRFGETHSFAGSALDPGPQREVFAFNLLGVGLANGRRRRGQVPFIDPSPIRIEVLQAKGLEQLLQFDKDGIRAPPKRIRQHHATQVINGMPQPPLVRFAFDKTPHLIHLGGLHAPHFDRDRVRTTPFHHAAVDLGQPDGFFLIPAARYWTRRARHAQYRESHSH